MADYTGFRPIGTDRDGNIPQRVRAKLVESPEVVEALLKEARRQTSQVLVDDFMRNGETLGVAMRAAFDAANGRAITFTRGATYESEPLDDFIDRSVTIDFNGARIVRKNPKANIPMFRFFNTNSTPQAVSAITVAEYVWPNGDTTTVDEVAVADTSGWSAGDWMVIVGSNLIPGGNPTRSPQRDGERVRVLAVRDGVITLRRRLRARLTNDIRAARMGTAKVKLLEPWVEDQLNYGEWMSAAAIEIVGGVKPEIVGANLENLASEGIRYVGCVGARTRGARGRKLRTNYDRSAYGYLVRDMASTDSLHTDLFGEDLRHTYTTGGFEQLPALDDRLWRFGSTYGCRVQGSNSGEVGHAAFDFHEEAAYGEIADCVVGLTYNEQFGSPWAFQLRGRRNTLRNDASYNWYGFKSISYDGGGGHNVVNFKHYAPRGFARMFELDNSKLTAGRASLTMESSSFKSDGDFRGNVGILKKAQLRVPDKLSVKAPVVAFTEVFNLTDSSFEAEEIYIDLRGSTQTDIRIFALTDDSSSVSIGTLTVLTDGQTWRIANLYDKNGSVRINKLVTDTLPITTDGGATGMAAGYTGKFFVAETVVDRVSRHDDVKVQAAAALTITPFIERTVRLGASSLDADITVTEPTRGFPPGMEITYIRPVAGSGVWRIGGSATLTAANTQLTRKLVGSSWVSKSKTPTV